MKNNIFHKKQQSIIIGITTLLATVLFGVAIAFVTGANTPTPVHAFVGPPCCTLPLPSPLPPIPPPVIIPILPIAPPSCTLSVLPTVLSSTGGSATLSWKTMNATSGKINNSVGILSSLSKGSVSVHVSATGTYTLSVSGTNGIAHCDATVKVTPQPPPPESKPTCTLSASPVSIQTGSSSKLTYTTTHATSFTVNHSVGTLTPVSGGSTHVSPTQTTFYTGTATGAGGTVTCGAHVTVTTTPPPPPTSKPTCTLSASPVSIQTGSSSKLTYTTTHATSFTVNHTVGTLTPTAGGSKTVSPIITTSYTGTATGAGGTVTCATKITVKVIPPPPPPESKPTCTLSSSPSSIQTGSSSKLTYTTTHATSFTVNHSVGILTPTAGGSKTVSPIITTSYTGTATGAGGTVTCATKITVKVTPPPPPPTSKPTCTLSASPTSVSSGSHATLSWTTHNAATLFIDNGIGTTTPVAAGATSTPALLVAKTYTATATSATGATATCHATVTIKGGGGGGPTCSLSLTPTSLQSGSSSTLSWSGSRLESIFINNGIGTTTSLSGSKKISPSVGTHTYVGTFKATNGQTLICSATVVVTGGGGCTGNCGGGGKPPIITLTQLSKPHPQHLAFVYLSQIPYTGLDLGTFGTIVYWLVLILWSLVVAYIILFILIPFSLRYARIFGEKVREALNTQAPLAAVSATHASSSLPAPVKTKAEPVSAPVNNFSPYEGFRSFAQMESPTVEDIVKGLSRSMSVAEVKTESVVPQSPPSEEMENFLETGVLLEQVEQAMILSKKAPQEKEVQQGKDILESTETPALPHTEESTLEMASTDTRGFLAALLGGDRTAVFALLRQVARGGGGIDRLITNATCALDDAYRARVDGTACDPDIARLSAKYSTQVLEQVVAALTTAIDSSYSSDITGAKLALTRALSSIGA